MFDVWPLVVGVCFLSTLQIKKVERKRGITVSWPPTASLKHCQPISRLLYEVSGFHGEFGTVWNISLWRCVSSQPQSEPISCANCTWVEAWGWRFRCRCSDCPEAAPSRSHGRPYEPAASRLTGRTTGGRRVRNVAGIPSCCINQQLREWLFTSASFSHRWLSLCYTTGGNDGNLFMISHFVSTETVKRILAPALGHFLSPSVSLPEHYTRVYSLYISLNHCIV